MVNRPRNTSIGDRVAIMQVGKLAQAARSSGMAVPQDVENYEAREFPHFFLFVHTQLCRPLPKDDSSAHWHNARIIANIPDEDIRRISLADLERMGFK